jgi:hypothetical protein
MELLAKFEAGTQNWGDTGHSHDPLTPAMISAACSGADPVGLDLLLAQICQNRACQIKAFYPIYLGIVALALNNGWKMREKQDRLRSLSQLAVFEATNDQACPRCKGTKYDPRRPTKACTPCRGTGKYRIKDYQRAAAIGVSTKVWSVVWQPRYIEIEIYIGEQKYKALKEIRKKLLT